jgi:catechol 2,3-dioxygenase-like lactoylglutathione lyase family enzyme
MSRTSRAPPPGNLGAQPSRPVKFFTRRFRGNATHDGRVQVGTGFSHLVVQVDELAATIEALTKAGLQPGLEQLPAGPAGRRTSWLTDPDGYRIELVQWPPGHPDGIGPADFA